MFRFQSALQLANERERTALEMAEEARQMAEKALEEEAKAKEKERKAPGKSHVYWREAENVEVRMHFVMDLFCYCYVVVF